MPDDLLLRLRNFQDDYFPHHQQRFLREDGSTFLADIPRFKLVAPATAR